jgi:hypothetical protein
MFVIMKVKGIKSETEKNRNRQFSLVICPLNNKVCKLFTKEMLQKLIFAGFINVIFSTMRTTC